MATLTQRENLMRVFNKEIPDWVPISEHASQMCFGPSYMSSWSKYEGKKQGDIIYDRFGVMHEVIDPRIGAMPVANVFKVPDITKWRDDFPMKDWPDLTKLDWEAYAAKDTELWDRANYTTNVAFGGNSSGSTYMWMATLMGHENAMIAMLTEPEAWHDLLDELTKFQEYIIKQIAYYYKPDCISMADDCAYNKGTFMSPESYREFIKPYHARLIKTIQECDIIPTIHCCGKADAIADDFVEIGIRSWNPAQVFNDLEGVMARHGNNLILNGCWESNGPAGIAGASEDVVRSAVRRSIDRCAPGGGYVFSAAGMTLEWAVGTEHINWIYDEATKYGATFYNK